MRACLWRPVTRARALPLRSTVCTMRPRFQELPASLIACMYDSFVNTYVTQRCGCGLRGT
eukprot:4784779-Prymnesium_polylepis.3